MKSGNIKEHALEVFAGIDELLEKHGYKRNDKGFYDVLEHNDDNIVFFCHFGVTALIMSHLIGVAAPVIWQGMMMAPTSITVMGSEERIPGEASFRVQTFADSTVKDGVIGSYKGVDIYIHRTQIKTGEVKDLESYVGQTLDILVTKFDTEKGRLRISGSHRIIVSEERRKKSAEIWDNIEEGKHYKGVVRSLVDFGAFIDIGGVDGLVHVSELSWSRNAKPAAYLNQLSSDLRQSLVLRDILNSRRLCRKTLSPSLHPYRD